MLGALLHDDLFYCEWYSEADCCQAVPCSRRGASQVSLQKSHDFDLNVPKHLTDVVYLIQHRAPVPTALSAREFHAGAYGVALASDRGEYAVWLGRHAEYYLAFCQRWLLDPPRNSVIVDYDDLASRPARRSHACSLALTSARLETPLIRPSQRRFHRVAFMESVRTRPARLSIADMWIASYWPPMNRSWSIICHISPPAASSSRRTRSARSSGRFRGPPGLAARRPGYRTRLGGQRAETEPEMGYCSMSARRCCSHLAGSDRLRRRWQRPSSSRQRIHSILSELVSSLPSHAWRQRRSPRPG